MDALKLIAEGCVKEANPAIRVGDVVKVHVKIREGERERIQVFEGTIIARKGAGVSETFTVRRVSYGVGVERVILGNTGPLPRPIRNKPIPAILGLPAKVSKIATKVIDSPIIIIFLGENLFTSTPDKNLPKVIPIK